MECRATGPGFEPAALWTTHSDSATRQRENGAKMSPIQAVQLFFDVSTNTPAHTRSTFFVPHFGHLNMSAIVCTPSRHRDPWLRGVVGRRSPAQQIPSQAKFQDSSRSGLAGAAQPVALVPS